MTTYGTHRDRLAHSLAQLLTTPEQQPHLTPTETQSVLACRDLLLTSLTAMTTEVLAGAAGVDRSLAAAAHAPARALRSTLHQLPTAADPIAPTHVLAQTPTTGYTGAWRTAAKHGLLAADALATGQPSSWRTEPDTAWAVMADTAAAVHALAVLDRRLATHPTPHLDDNARDALNADWRSGLRLVASEVSRLAHTQPLSDHADDLARPPVLRPYPLTDTAQLAAGYQHALRLLQARDGMLPYRTLGHVLIAQARLAHTLADHCHQAHAAGTPAADALTQTWRQHATTAETLAAHRRAVTGLNPTVHHPALTQLGEVLRALEHLPAPTCEQHTDAVHLAHQMQPTAGRIQHTLAAGIETSFARDLYLVPNEHTTKIRGRHPWVSVRHNLEPHPLLTTAREIRAATPTVPQPAVTHHPGPPRARQQLWQALNAAEPIRSGTPARALP